MDTASFVLVAIAIFTIIFGIIGWLLSNKDARQEEQIKLLFAKHDADAKELQDLKLEIAQRHYVKDELDSKFEKLEVIFSKGFADMGAKFDKLSDNLTNTTTLLIDHMRKEDTRA